jgi:predicted TIM-barrel fold metal-dependent hydrolase
VTTLEAGDTPLVDTDVHEAPRSMADLLPYVAPEWRETAALSPTIAPSAMPYRSLQGFRQDWLPDEGIAGSDLDALRRHLFAEEGVSVAILNGFFHVSALRGGFEYANAMASAYNDWQIEHWLEPEPRLRGSVHVVAHTPELAAREIDRVGKHDQIVQVFLPTVTDRQYGDPHYLPIFEAALRNDLVVAFHHGQHTQTVLGYPRYYVEWHMVAANQAAMSQLTSLLFNGVFDRLPDLKAVFLETGVAWIPWFSWRADQQYREARAEVPWVKRLPSEHLRERVRISTQPLGDLTPAQFAQVVELAGAEAMFVFSSDYPHYDADLARDVLPRTLPGELRDRVRYRNAVETYPRLGVAVPA